MPRCSQCLSIVEGWRISNGIGVSRSALESCDDIVVVNWFEQFEGVFEVVEFGGLVGVGADDEGYAKGVHVAKVLARGIEVGVAAFVDATGVQFTDAACFVYEVKSLIE